MICWIIALVAAGGRGGRHQSQALVKMRPDLLSQIRPKNEVTPNPNL